MRLFTILMTVMLVASSVPARAVILNGEGQAARMNRDYDYPGDPSDQTYLKMPSRDKILRYERDMAKYEVYQQRRAVAEWKAMTPDEKRRFMRRHPEAFAPGGYLYDTY